MNEYGQYVAEDLSGRRFGFLTAIKLTLVRYRGYAVWLCRCDCGEEIRVPSGRLRNGKRVRCDKCRSTPGVSRTHLLTYRSWRGMIERCYRPDVAHQRNYAGRGIVVCERWRGSFAAFLADMGERPSRRHSIERIDNDGNYELGNCKWALPSEQMRNTRRTIWVDYDGERVRLVELCERLGLGYALVRNRIRLDWPLSRALSVGKQAVGRPNKPPV